MTVNVLIADDHPIVVEGIRSGSATADIVVVGEVSESSQLSDMIEQVRPDVLISEVRLKGNDVIRAMEEHSVERSGCRLVFFSSSASPSHIARADTIECHDYLLKTSPLETLWQAVHRAAAGQSTPPESLLKTTRKRVRDTSRWSADEIPLTQRELQVLQHVAMGLSNREIGRALGISVETVKEHVQNTLRKLDASDRTQAAVWAVREGWI